MTAARRSLQATFSGVLGMSMAFALSAFAAPQDSARTFAFTYEAEVPAQPAGTGPIDVFIPLAVSDAHQSILRRDVKASISGREAIESRYGNMFWHGHVDHSDGKPITVVVDYIVQRRTFEQQRLTSSAIRAYSQSERKELALSLGPDRLVPIDGPLIDRVRAELPQTDPSPLARARAIYDYVIDNMEYKKVGSGWGNGDTFWACSARYGNCTDFHALFISLARADGIPAGQSSTCPAWDGSPSMRPKHGSARSAAISISARSLPIASSSPSGGIWNWETATPPIR
jgi:transglutaminase-like putative cysteine protease